MTEREYFDYMFDQSRHGCGSGIVCAIFVAIVAMALLCGCKTQYVTVPEYHTEYVYRTDSVTLRDSIWQHDSVYVMKNGDTITTIKTKTIYRDRWRDVVRVDSFIKTDSIRVPYPVERQLSRWEQFCIDWGKITLGVTLAALAAILIIIVMWLRRHTPGV